MKKKWSLMTRLMVWINVASAIIVISLSLYSMSDSMKRTENQVKNEMIALADIITLTSADYIWNLNSEALKTVAQELVHNEQIEAVYFTDTKNVLITKSEEAGLTEEVLKTLESTKLQITYGADKQVIGFVEIKYNLKSVELVKKSVIKSTIVGLVVAQLVLLVIMWILLRTTTKNLGVISSGLRVLSDETKKSSGSVRAISEEVSSSTTEQAASIQETVTTLDEITSMVNSSVDNASKSAKKAEESHSIANEGKEVVKDMIRSMEEIDHSNKNIMDEISKSNERIGSIIKVIDEISEKTTVINDIVFQTKLLSFNASVEAARAGEHGKGFAVVAEEVGKLAQMSGRASNEISDMLQESIGKVNDIITETNTNVQKLINEGNSKVKAGVVIADKCGKVLDEVVDNAAVVKAMMNEVSVASKEQAEGVKNITLAMNQLDQATHTNANAANRSFENSKELLEQADKLKVTVEELEVEIFGGVGQVRKNQTPEVKPSLKILKTEEKKVERKKDVLEKPLELVKKEEPSNVTPIKKNEKKELSKKVSKAVAVEVKVEKKSLDFGKSEEKMPKQKNAALGIPVHNDPRFEDV